jgi:hypothetical protein
VALSGLFSDPQLLARRHWRVRRHPEIGDQAYCFPGFDLESAPGASALPRRRQRFRVPRADMQGYAERGVFG